MTVHPDSWWWVKADGVDLVPGLGESMRREWSGDVDLNDGSLQEQYNAYIQRLDFIKNLGLGKRKSHSQLLQDLHASHQDLAEDLSSIGKRKYAVIIIEPYK